MPDVRIRDRDAAEFHEARSLLGRLADDYESDGLTPDELGPRLRSIREHIDERESEIRRAMREAGG